MSAALLRARGGTRPTWLCWTWRTPWPLKRSPRHAPPYARQSRWCSAAAPRPRCVSTTTKSRRTASPACGRGCAPSSCPRLRLRGQVERLDAFLSQLEAERGIAAGTVEIMPMVESAVGVQNAYDIALGSPRVRAFGVLGEADLTADLGLSFDDLREIDVLAYARGEVGLAARALGKAVNGRAWTPGRSTIADYGDAAALELSMRASWEAGCRSTFCVHPAQVAAANRLLRPIAVGGRAVCGSHSRLHRGTATGAGLRGQAGRHHRRRHRAGGAVDHRLRDGLRGQGLDEAAAPTGDGGGAEERTRVDARVRAAILVAWAGYCVAGAGPLSFGELPFGFCACKAIANTLRCSVRETQPAMRGSGWKA